MEEPSQTHAPLRFGAFELDVRSRELRKGETRIRLQEQPFEILRFMLERPGDVVTRGELCQRLWPDGTFVDFEHSLNAAVKRLRAALGDDAERPRFVETLPRRGYRFIAPLEAADAGGTVGSAAAPARLAVLPFTNLSDDAAQEYFSDGLTEELIAQLGPMCRGHIGIIARRSSMAFKGSAQRACEIAQILQVRYLLEGSVRRDGQRVRITARLVEGETETELWSDTHDRTVADWLSVQSDVAAHVARSLMVELAPARDLQLAPDPRAHQAYLKARYHWTLPGDSGFDDAVRYARVAVTIAPEFAAAHAVLARLHIGGAEYYRDVPRRHLDAARTAAVRALELDPANGEARLALADVMRMADFDWRGARDVYRDVLASNPSSEIGHRGYACLLAVRRRFDDAIRAADVARALDPLCLMPSVTAAWTRYVAGRYDEALEVCAHTIDMGATYVAALRLRALARLQAGEMTRAAEELEASIEATGVQPTLVATLAHVYGSSGRAAEARALIAELHALETRQYVSPYHVALACIGVGDADGAFAALDGALRDRDPNLAHVVIEPRVEPIRSDPRFERLVAALELTTRGR